MAPLDDGSPSSCRTWFRAGLQLFGFIPESRSTFVPESRSDSSRNGVRNHPGITFTFIRIPHIDLDQFAGQFAETVIFSDFILGLAESGRGGEGLGNGLALHLVGQPVERPMARIILLMAMTARIAAAAARCRDRTSAHVTELGNLLECSRVVLPKRARDRAWCASYA